jgi:hypothetical protein
MSRMLLVRLAMGMLRLTRPIMPFQYMNQVTKFHMGHHGKRSGKINHNSILEDNVSVHVL